MSRGGCRATVISMLIGLVSFAAVIAAVVIDTAG